MNLRKLATFVFILVWIIWVSCLFYWVNGYLKQELVVKVVELMASIHESGELPVYSKFYVEQTVKLPEKTKVSSVVVPIRQPGGYKNDVYVDIVGSNGQKISRQFETTEQIREMNIPVSLDDEIDSFVIRISSPEASWKTKDQAAIRVYRDQASSGYRDGDMNIAGVFKEGNIALSVYSELSRWNFFKYQTKLDIKNITEPLRNLLVIVFLIISPSTFAILLWTKK